MVLNVTQDLDSECKYDRGMSWSQYNRYLLLTSVNGIFIIPGVLSWSSIIYLDVVKSRIQSDCLVNPRYNGTLDTFRKCYREGGLRIFGRGWTVMAIRAFPVNGATFLV